MKKKLFGKTLEELQELILAEGMQKFVAKQIADWLYKKQIQSVDEMRNLSKSNLNLLNEKFEIGLYPPKSSQESVDGTKKYLYTAGEARFIEAAYIPDRKRATLCVSSQVGCKMGCLFCMTGKQGSILRCCDI